MMESMTVQIHRTQPMSVDSLPFARCYQLEALEKAMKQNTIVFLETGSGKTLIAIMLLRSYAYMLRKPSPYIAVFLVPQVVLVKQQAEVVRMHTDLNVGMYWGDMGVDFWNAATWKGEIEKHEVLVMTPAILLDGLRHSFFDLNMIKVLIFDECHHARGRYPYACIMTEFYHHQLQLGASNLPRIFGMTASPIKSKGANSGLSYWKQINELETLMNSKVFTCASESVLAQYIPFSTPKFKLYKRMDIPYALYERIVESLKNLKQTHENSLDKFDLEESAADSIKKRLSKIHSNLLFCLDELGVWLALKAAQSFTCNEAETDFYSWGQLDAFGEHTVKKFSLDASNLLAPLMPSGSSWSIGNDVKANMDAGFITSKIDCLIKILLEYRHLKDIRCIIFVERVIGAIVLPCLLNELLPKHNSWNTKYIAGNNSMLQSQTRKKQNEIVEEFRKGAVNIIVATSILEEGLDVQSCNLVIRFDPSATVCSFIQSRGRARMQNSDYVLMLKSGDVVTRSRLENYLSSGETMRKESLGHASLPCAPLKSELFDEQTYRVESTGAIVTLSSSVSLIYFYCARLPSDGYFKPTPRCDIDKENGVAVLHLPKSCPVRTVQSHGNPKILKQIVCLDACKLLHKVGALTDHLVPDIVVEEEEAALASATNSFNNDQPKYFPPELVNHCPDKSGTMYHCYLIQLKQKFNYEISVDDVMLVTRTELELDCASFCFDLEVDRGGLAVNLKYAGLFTLDADQVVMCMRFQVALFRILMDRNLDRLLGALNGCHMGSNVDIHYLLLPSGNKLKETLTINWSSVYSVWFPNNKVEADCMNYSSNCHAKVQTKNGLVCMCTLINSLVCTPHNGHIYCITGIIDELDGNSPLRQRDGTVISYKEYYRTRYGVGLQFEKQPLFRGRHIHKVKNYLSHCRPQKDTEPSQANVELPAELCSIIMSEISICTVYSFSFVPSIMHRIESLLIATNLSKMPLGHCMQNVKIPTIKVLEAITTKECQEKFHLESLETLGDSFLKYAVGQQLFQRYQNHHEGLLSIKKDKIISNNALCKRGCDRKLPGFIRNESFDPKRWIIPGDNSENYEVIEELVSCEKKIYVKGRNTLKSKKVADVVEALIGAYLSSGGEKAALLFMDWLGIEVDLLTLPYETFQLASERIVNVKDLESLLNYKFREPSLLVEALTHGSYMLPEIPRCYQRLEFLGDSVLDYLITVYLYNTFPGLSPGMLTDMRSASVNNDCYAQSAVKAGLHKHILHTSHELHKHIRATVSDFDNISLQSTFGWECEASFPKVLGDVIESLAGAIFVDSGYNKDAVFQSIRPLLEPLVTPKTLKLQPVRELNELCQKHGYTLKNSVLCISDGVAAITVEVEANGVTHKHTSTAKDKKTAKKLAFKQVLKSLKPSMKISKY